MILFLHALVGGFLFGFGAGGLIVYYAFKRGFLEGG